MKNISTGTGLCVLGICAVLYPVIDRLVPTAGVAQAAAPSATTNIAKGPSEPTIVWYGTTGSQLGASFANQWILGGVVRAWSDGRVEQMATRRQMWGNYGGIDTWCDPATQTCTSPWFVISSPNQGYSAASDINFDHQVDGADLGQLLAMWGPAPRHDIPPSDCPLNLINP